jgi:AraC-like DNA-binding protein
MQLTAPKPSKHWNMDLLQGAFPGGGAATAALVSIARQRRHRGPAVTIVEEVMPTLQAPVRRPKALGVRQHTERGLGVETLAEVGLGGEGEGGEDYHEAPLEEALAGGEGAGERAGADRRDVRMHLAPGMQLELAREVKELARLHARKDQEEKRLGREVSIPEWAALLGVTERTLNRRLQRMQLARSLLVTTNVMLVYSIARRHFKKQDFQDVR